MAMAKKLAPAHREFDGRPIKTAVIDRTPKDQKPRQGALAQEPEADEEKD